MRMTDPKFKTLVGLRRQWFEELYNQTISIASTNTTYWTVGWRFILLITVVNFKQYPTNEFISFIFGIPESSFRNYLNWSLDILVQWSLQRIYLPPRHIRDQYAIQLFNKQISLVFDIKEQQVVTSTDLLYEDITFSGKYMEHTISNLVASDPTKGKVTFLSATFPGSKNDMNVASHYEWNQLLDLDEFILSDEGFAGDKIITKSQQDNTTRRLIDQHRIIIENVFGWITNFQICDNKLRFKTYTSGYDRDMNSFLLKVNKIWRIILALYNEFSSVRQ
jgi:hypothetical protein